MKLEAKPHIIEAFEFTHNMTDPPDWFVNAYKTGSALITINAKEQYISVSSKHGLHRAYYGDWVCLNQSGTMFVLSSEEINRGFNKIEEEN